MSRTKLDAIRETVASIRRDPADAWEARDLEHLLSLVTDLAAALRPFGTIGNIMPVRIAGETPVTVAVPDRGGSYETLAHDYRAAVLALARLSETEEET